MKHTSTATDRTARDGACPPDQQRIGLMEWFRPGEHQRVEAVLADLQRLNITHLRTGISWAEWYTPAGQAWYEWLFPRLARQVNVLPCFVYTPPSWSVAAKTSAPPHDLRSYGDYLDTMITRFGDYFQWVELWNEPNNQQEWDFTLDPYWLKFAEMIGGAAYWARQRGKKTVLGGMSPIDPNWLRMMCQRNVIDHIDAVAIHAFPNRCQFEWQGWEKLIGRVRDVLDQHKLNPEIWITETGYSTWRHDERRQLTSLVDALDAPAARVYWYAMQDLDPAVATVGGFHYDERDYHFGLKRSDGSEKLLFRLWAEGGLQTVRQAYWLGRGLRTQGSDRPALITGGCGFIGINVAHRLLSQERPVLLLDNLSRPGAERNLQWLKQTHKGRLRIEAADVRDAHALRNAVHGAAQVFHHAAQVAVTTSLVNAIHDFEVNARGTVNLLEAIRAQDDPPPLLFTSTNKVYGGLPDLKLRARHGRYEPEDAATRESGVDEARPLDFHSPYGCSKGAADQYVLDYARTFGLPAVVFRMSCIYGPHQYGNEDQGWVAHFLIRAMQNQPITIYGDGMQVRDILFIDDLVDAFLAAHANMSTLSGQAFNIGGGPANTISLIELLDLIETFQGRRPALRHSAWRPGDQRYYVSNTSRFQTATGWKPRVGVRQGVRRLQEWLAKQEFSESTAARPVKRPRSKNPAHRQSPKIEQNTHVLHHARRGR